MATFDLTVPVKIVNPTANVDALYGTYNSIPDALTGVPSVLRKEGRTVGILQSGSVTEYWFKNGILDSDLIPKGISVNLQSVLNAGSTALLNNIAFSLTQTSGAISSNLTMVDGGITFTGNGEFSYNDYAILTEQIIGVANGVPSLDGGGKIPAQFLPNSVMTLEGNWNAATNIPTLTNGIGNAGMVYEVTTAGTHNFGNGNITFAVGDWAVYGADGKWYKSLNSNEVTSVNGMTGTVLLTASDIPGISDMLTGYIPLTGTAPGTEVSGHIFVSPEISLYHDNGNNLGNFFFTSDAFPTMGLGSQIPSPTTVQLRPGKFVITGRVDLGAKGFSGDQDFSGNITDLDYTQKIYVDASIANAISAAGYVPYTGAIQALNLGNNNIYASAIGAGYGTSGLTSVPAWLAVRNPTIPTTGNTSTVFGVYNSTGVRSLYVFADEFDVHYFNNRGGGNISSNSAMGNFSLGKNTTGIINAAFSFKSLFNNTTGSRNAAFGSYAGSNNSTGNFNTFIGAQSGFSGTGNPAVLTGVMNTLIGQATGGGLTTGSRNTFVGRSSGGGSDTVGVIGVTTGSDNLFVSQGRDTDAQMIGITTGSANTVIGKLWGFSPNDSNWVVIGDGANNRAFEKNGSTGVINITGTILQFNGSPVLTTIKTVGGQSLIGTGNITEVQNSLTTSTLLAPSTDAVNTALVLKANDNAVVHLTGNENIAGRKTFTGSGDGGVIMVNASSVFSATAVSMTLPNTGDQKVLAGFISGQSNPFFQFTNTVGGAGKPGLWLGSGTSGLDTNLYRDSADVLKTDDNLIVNGKVTINTAPTANTDAIRLQDLSTNIVLSSTNVTLLTTTKIMYYTFNGTNTTAVLPVITGNTGARIFIINAGTGNATINSNAGGSDIWEGGSSETSTIISSGTVVSFYNNGLKWVLF